MTNTEQRIAESMVVDAMIDDYVAFAADGLTHEEIESDFNATALKHNTPARLVAIGLKAGRDEWRENWINDTPAKFTYDRMSHYQTFGDNPC